MKGSEEDICEACAFFLHLRSFSAITVCMCYVLRLTHNKVYYLQSLISRLDSQKKIFLFYSLPFYFPYLLLQLL
uniref:Ovule protein n=1 Tax=Meloidogyne incognita TaxID=6306 RepID=A0A914MB41_MELIC